MEPQGMPNRDLNEAYIICRFRVRKCWPFSQMRQFKGWKREKTCTRDTKNVLEFSNGVEISHFYIEKWHVQTFRIWILQIREIGHNFRIQHVQVYKLMYVSLKSLLGRSWGSIVSHLSFHFTKMEFLQYFVLSRNCECQ